jgi:hypothetical protein
MGLSAEGGGVTTGGAITTGGGAEFSELPPQAGRTTSNNKINMVIFLNAIIVFLRVFIHSL